MKMFIKFFAWILDKTGYSYSITKETKNKMFILSNIKTRIEPKSCLYICNGSNIRIKNCCGNNCGKHNVSLIVE